MKITTVVMFGLLYTLNLNAAEWKMTMVFPDNEKKEYLIPDKGMEIPLKQSTWKCSIGKESKRNKTFLRSVTCKQLGSTGEIQIIPGCSKNNPNDITFNVVDASSTTIGVYCD